MIKPFILSIGYGRHLFVPDNSERARLQACATETACVHMVVFSLRSHAVHQERVSDTFVLYPTNSRFRLLMVFDAIRIGRYILRTRDSKEKWCITTQDPLASGVVGFVLRMLTKVPLLVQEHGDIFSGNFWRNETLSHRVWYWIGRFVIKRADRVRAVSLRVQNHLLEVGVAKGKIVRLPVYTEIAHFLDTEVNAVKDNGICDILTVARFVPQKNLQMLLRAFAHVHTIHPRARLTLIGTGPLAVSFAKESVALGLSDEALKILPWSPQVSAHMHRADIYALSSNYEGWGRVLVEAMACGLPSVTTDVGCVDEVFIHEQHGLVVPVGDVEAFAAALSALIESKEKRMHLAKQCREDAVHIFSDVQTYARSWAAVHSF